MLWGGLWRECWDNFWNSTGEAERKSLSYSIKIFLRKEVIRNGNSEKINYLD